MNIGAIFQIIQFVLPAVQAAEKYIRGRGRGAEKKEAVVSEVLGELESQVGIANSNEDFESLAWADKALENTPELVTLIGNVVDAVVALLNFIRKLDDEA